MRIITLAGAVAILSLAATDSGSAQSRHFQGPWCLHEDIGWGTVVSRCTMRSYEMCRAEMRGLTSAHCTENPSYYHRRSEAREPRQPRRRPAR